MLKVDIPVVFRLTEVCKIFRISRKKLTLLIKSGAIKTLDFGGRDVFVPRSEIEKWLQQDLRYVDLEELGVVLKFRDRRKKKTKVRFIDI